MKKTNILKLIVVSALAIIIAVASSSVSLGATYNYKTTNVLDNLTNDSELGLVIPIVPTNNKTARKGVITVDTVTNNFKSKGLTIKKISTGSYVGTGTKITVNENALTYTVLIYGDINGDGKVNAGDMSSLIEHMVTSNKLTGIRYKAADIANSGNKSKINAGDLSLMISFIIGDEGVSKCIIVDPIITAPDTEKPVIKLKGNATETVEAKSTYKDAGATATDNFDGNITSKIIKTGSVNTSKTGTYTLKYNVTDAAGNKATEVTRKVVVKDTKAPTIALNGDATVEVLVGETYTESNATASDIYDGDLTSKIVKTGSVDTSTVGKYYIKYNVKDSSGNSATEKIRTVKVVDKVKPVITMNGDAEVTVDGGSVYEDDGATATDNYDSTVIVNVDNPVNTAIPGTYTVTYTATDAAGNVADQKTRTVVVNSLPIEALDITTVNLTAETNTNFVIARVKEADRQTYRTAISLDALTVESSSDALTLATSLNTDNEVVITGTTQTTGSYTVTLTLGEITETIDVTVTKNAIVDSVAIAEIGATDVRIGKNTEKALTFKNENDEEVSVMAKYLTVQSSDNIIVTKLDENKNIISNDSDDVKYIRITPTTTAEAGENNATITLTVEDDEIEIATEDATTTETFSINAESVLTTVTVAPTTTIRENQVSPISLTFLNQDEEEMDDILASDIAFSEDIFNSNTDKKIAVLTPEAEIVEMPGETLEALEINTYRVTATDEIITGNNLFTYIGARIKDTELSGMPMTINREDLKGKSITIKYRTANGIETISTTIVIPD